MLYVSSWLGCTRKEEGRKKMKDRRTCYTSNDKWLSSKYGKDKSRHERGEENFFDSIFVCCFDKIEGECDSRENANNT